MNIPLSDWLKFTRTLSALNNKAASELAKYITKQGGLDAVDRDALVGYAYGLVTKYGEGAAAAAAEMYDAIAVLSGASVAPAVPAQTATFAETAKAINGTMKTGNEEIVVNSAGRLVKMAGVDTTMKNALRDGAEWAWIPNGDTCAFCIMLASNGWQKASKKALKGNHASHIHANCDCTFAIRFDRNTDVQGYNDGKRYRQMYEYTVDENGKMVKRTGNWSDKLNGMRRDFYALNKNEGLANLNASIAEEINVGSVAKATARAIPKFTPVKTTQEAEEFARQFTDSVSLSGMSLKNANAINEQLQILTSKYPIKTLEVLESTQKTRGVASANWKSLKINPKKLGKTLEDAEKARLANRERTKESIRVIEERWRGKKMPFRIQHDLERLQDELKFVRWGVPDTAANKVAALVTHEYGHTLSDQYFGMVNQEMANPNMALNWSIRGMNDKWKQAYLRAIKDGDIYQISEYASTNVKEFFAECFTAREFGEKLPDYIEDLMKEVLENGIMQ